jgi:hypothetical protein
MSSVISIEDFKEETRIEFIDYITQVLDLAVDQYDEIFIEVEERLKTSRANVEFIFGEFYIKESKHSWSALCLTIDGIFERYRKKYSADEDYIKLFELYKALEEDYKDLFDEYL